MGLVAGVNLETVFPSAIVEGNNTVEITLGKVRDALSLAMISFIKHKGFTPVVGINFSIEHDTRMLFNNLVGVVRTAQEISFAIESVRTRALRLLGTKFPLQNLIGLSQEDKKDKSCWNRRDLIQNTISILTGEKKTGEPERNLENDVSLGYFERCSTEKLWDTPPSSEEVLRTIGEVAHSILGEDKLKGIHLEQNGAWNGSIDFTSFLRYDVEGKNLIGRIIQILVINKFRPGNFIPDNSEILLPGSPGNTLGSIFNSVFPWIITGKEEAENRSQAIVLSEGTPRTHSEILAKNFRVPDGETRILSKMPSWDVKSEGPFGEPDMENGINKNSELYAVLAEARYKKSYLAFGGLLWLSFYHKYVSIKVPRKGKIETLVNKLLKDELGFQLYTEETSLGKEIPYYIARDDFREAVTICVAVARLLNRDILLNFEGDKYQITPHNEAHELYEQYLNKIIYVKCLLEVFAELGNSNGIGMLSGGERGNALPWKRNLLHG